VPTGQDFNFEPVLNGKAGNLCRSGTSQNDACRDRYCKFPTFTARNYDFTPARCRADRSFCWLRARPGVGFPARSTPKGVHLAKFVLKRTPCAFAPRGSDGPRVLTPEPANTDYLYIRCASGSFLAKERRDRATPAGKKTAPPPPPPGTGYRRSPRRCRSGTVGTARSQVPRIRPIRTSYVSGLALGTPAWQESGAMTLLPEASPDISLRILNPARHRKNSGWGTATRST
jgi:hypothetical protein